MFPLPINDKDGCFKQQVRARETGSSPFSHDPYSPPPALLNPPKTMAACNAIDQTLDLKQ
jgi:hypothetical protein